MLHALNDLLAPAAVERLTLLLNHVLSREALAVQRLMPHAGSTLCVRPERWPGWLPALPSLAFRVTPAGLVEWCGNNGVDAPDLTLWVDASNPAALALAALAGDTPAVRIDGPVLLAADINWLLQNLRWDVPDDLERLFGPTAAAPLQQLGSWLARGLKAALQGVQVLTERVRPPAR